MIDQVSLRLVIVGYGRMGHEIEAVAADRGHSIIATVDPHAPGATCPTIGEAAAQRLLGPTTTVIDFSLAEAVGATVGAVIETGAALVLGTTGWDAQRNELLGRASAAGTRLVWGNNFSVGANLYLRLAEYGAALADAAGSYDAAIVELHHSGKADSPSGTALSLANRVTASMSGKRDIVGETLHRTIAPAELHVASARVGAIAGTHTLYLDSAADTIEITHRARTRSGFALGAVQAAEWIASQTGVHPVDDFFTALFDVRKGEL